MIVSPSSKSIADQSDFGNIFTKIQSETVLVLRGGARTYALIGDAMERLAHGRTANAPVLVSSGVRDNLHPDVLEYEVRLHERSQ